VSAVRVSRPDLVALAPEELAAPAVPAARPAEGVI
jgi:hypothetical protein